MSRDAASVLILAALLTVLPGWSFFDPFHEQVEKGNDLAESGEQDEALARYQEAARVDPSSPIPDFNRGVVLSGKGEAAEALDAFRAASASEDTTVAADALYNMGNVHLESQEFEPAIETYLKSLDLDPDDADARRNLEIALQRLQEQQQQQQQQDGEDQNDENEEQDEQQPQPQDSPEDSEEDESQNEQPQPDESQEDEQPEPEPQPEEERLSREDAERLLNAVQSDELKVLEQLNQQPPPQGVVTHDW